MFTVNGIAMMIAIVGMLISAPLTGVLTYVMYQTWLGVPAITVAGETLPSVFVTSVVLLVWAGIQWFQAHLVLKCESIIFRNFLPTVLSLQYTNFFVFCIVIAAQASRQYH